MNDLFPALKIVYFGSSGSLSTLPLRALIGGAHEIVAVVVHEPGIQTNKLAVVAVDDSSSVKTIAFQSNINIIGFGRSISDVESKLAESPFDLILTSCFARRIPPKILALPRLASINLHPSLLPKYRGPDPIFWQLRNAVRSTGVTWHLMTEHFDEGAIVTQRAMTLDKDSTFSGISDDLGRFGAEMLVELLNDIESSIQRALPQSGPSSSYQSWPDISDYTLSDEWDAARLFYFVRATLGRVPYYPIRLKGKAYKILRVLDYHVSIQRKLSVFDQKLYFPCHTGHVCAEILTD